MGIYIKEIEMPKDKAIAVVIHPDGTAYSAEMSAGVCTEYLKDCVAIPVSPQWIPVTERLPEDGEDGPVLCVRKSKCFLGKTYIQILIANTGHFRDGCVFVADGDVTHWMPLPTTPAVDTEEQP